MQTGDRIAALRNSMGMTQAALAREVGVRQGTIAKLETGFSAGSSYLHKIARILHTTPAYLACETDDPLEGYVAPPPATVVAEEMGLVPVREMDMAFGMGATFLDAAPETIRIQHFPRDWLRNFTASPPEDLFFAHAVGDSMQPTMVSGDIVLIDRRDRIVDRGDLIWAFGLEGMGMIKRLGPAKGGQVEIISDNSPNRLRYADPSELHIVGRVVAVVRKM